MKIILLSLMLAFAFTACDNQNQSDADNSSEAVDERNETLILRKNRQLTMKKTLWKQNSIIWKPNLMKSTSK